MITYSIQAKLYIYKHNHYCIVKLIRRLYRSS